MRIIAGCQYIPSIEYFARWMYHGTLMLEACEHYHKRTWRNKTAIQHPVKPLYLSVPLRKGKNNQKPIREVDIAYDEPWPKVHLSSLHASYGKTSFFEEIEVAIRTIYTDPPARLWDLNISFLHVITSLIPSEWKIELTESYQSQYSDDWEDFRSGIPGGISSLNPEDLPMYLQVHRMERSFMPNLSILDLLCHLGPGTKDYLSSYAHQLYHKHAECH